MGQPASTPAAPPAEHLPPPGEIPEGLEADFAPLRPPGEPARSAETDPYHEDSRLAQAAFDEAVRLVEAGREGEAVHRFLTGAKLAEAAREWYLAALAFRRVGDFLVNPTPPFDLDRAVRMYRRAVDAYHRCGLVDEARELAYHVLRLQMIRGRDFGLPWHRRAELRAYWAVAGFGLRPLRVVAAAAVIVFLFGLAYWLLGGVVAAAGGQPAGLAECVYFSGITFTTVGYGDLLPTRAARPLALVESGVGALAIAFFVAVLMNRLRR